MVHGDIKPANIMLAHHGMVKIMDFGIALAADAGKVLDDRMPGSPTYLAPEQVTGGSSCHRERTASKSVTPVSRPMSRR